MNPQRSAKSVMVSPRSSSFFLIFSVVGVIFRTVRYKRSCRGKGPQMDENTKAIVASRFVMAVAIERSRWKAAAPPRAKRRGVS